MKVEAPVYTSKIIKASALLPDTRLLLAHWDEDAGTAGNLSRLRQENIFGKASRSRVEDVLAIFRQRYLRDDSTIRALTALVKLNVSSQTLDRILFFYAARTDKLLHDIVTEVLWEWRQQGRVEVHVDEVQRRIEGWAVQGKTTGQWSPTTLRCVAQHLMATLRDFGILSGAVNKQLAQPYLSAEAFAFIAFVLHQGQPSGTKLIHHPEWRLFFSATGGRGARLLGGAPGAALQYHAAGSIVRIEFPCDKLDDYAHLIAQRAA